MMMMNESSIRKGLAVSVALLAVSATAAPQPVTELKYDRPWARGVSPEAQESARKEFLEGNEVLKQAIFLLAIDKYRTAMKYWDHPAIHYNLALALVNADPLEGYRHMKEAIRYGARPLDEQKLEYAHTYLTIIENQSAWVEITCEVPGASVTLDGKPLFKAPGRYEGLAHPGEHSIVAVKEGFLPTEKSRSLIARERAIIGLKLYTEAELTRYRTRWANWVPWTVMGASAALALGSSAVHFQARDAYRYFDAGIIECGGCVPAPEVAGRRSRGDLLQGAAYGGYALGGAALITGTVLLVLNIPQPYRITSEEYEGVLGANTKPQASLMPWLGPRSGGAMLAFRF